jgi:hypothetical protein
MKPNVSTRNGGSSRSGSAATSMPSMRTSPVEGEQPAQNRQQRAFPDPNGPMTTTISPRSSSKSTSRTASTRVSPSLKTFDRRRLRTSGSVTKSSGTPSPARRVEDLRHDTQHRDERGRESDRGGYGGRLDHLVVATRWRHRQPTSPSRFDWFCLAHSLGVAHPLHAPPLQQPSWPPVSWRSGGLSEPRRSDRVSRAVR